MKLGIKKGNQKKLIGNIPIHYPADRVYLDGDTDKNVQDAIAQIPKSYVSSDIYLKDLTWAGGSGEYFASNIDIGLSNVTEILTICIQHWVSFGANAVLTPYIRQDNVSVGIRSNINSFQNNSLIRLKVLYI